MQAFDEAASPPEIQTVSGDEHFESFRFFDISIAVLTLALTVHSEVEIEQITDTVVP